MKSLESSIRKFALENAFVHKSKANEKAVLGKILASKLIDKKDIKTIMPKLISTVKEINSMSFDKQQKEIENKFPEILHHEKKEKGLSELPNAINGKVVTRIPPGPSNFMTAGHALSFLINYIYAKKYSGKCVLRIDDTNPDKDRKEYVDSVFEGLKFLEIKPNKTVYASDDVSKMYKEAEKLIEKNKAYVCFCSSEEISRLRKDKKNCDCSKTSISENQTLWKNMISKKYSEGECSLRLKGDMQSNNAVMRDPSIMRINCSNHYRQKKKFCVWPLYDFASACEEEWTGVTHVMRSIEFGNERIELQKYISKLLGFSEKTFVQYGRFNVIGLEKTSGRHLRELVEKKGYFWNSPSFPTMSALIRRGFVKETFYELAKKVGLSKTPTPIDDTLLSSINRKFLDKNCNRYFFVAEPLIEISLNGNFKKVSVLPLHPERDGNRKISVSKRIFITKEDFEKNKGKETRLKDLTNIILNKKAEVTDNELKHSTQKIHWISEDNIPAEILMTDEKTISGLCEPDCSKIKIGDIVQFERVGFARLEKKGKTLEFIFTHK